MEVIKKKSFEKNLVNGKKKTGRDSGSYPGGKVALGDHVYGYKISFRSDNK